MAWLILTQVPILPSTTLPASAARVGGQGMLTRLLGKGKVGELGRWGWVG